MKKGETLVEVIVAIAVFVVMFAGIAACLLSLSDLNRRQQAYVYFENICRNIDMYTEAEAKDWDQAYLGVSNPSADVDNQAAIYYRSDYTICQAEDSPRFCLEYYYNSESELIITVRDIDKGYAVISGLNYGNIAGE